MVTVDYMVGTSPPPAGVRRFINRRVIPIGIDIGASVENGIYALGQGTRRHPALALIAAAGIGAATAVIWRRRDWL